MASRFVRPRIARALREGICMPTWLAAGRGAAVRCSCSLLLLNLGNKLLHNFPGSRIHPGPTVTDKPSRTS